jgi:hypothetical protein
MQWYGRESRGYRRTVIAEFDKQNEEILFPPTTYPRRTTGDDNDDDDDDAI